MQCNTICHNDLDFCEALRVYLRKRSLLLRHFFLHTCKLHGDDIPLFFGENSMLVGRDSAVDVLRAGRSRGSNPGGVEIFISSRPAVTDAYKTGTGSSCRE